MMPVPSPRPYPILNPTSSNLEDPRTTASNVSSRLSRPGFRVVVRLKKAAHSIKFPNYAATFADWDALVKKLGKGFIVSNRVTLDIDVTNFVTEFSMASSEEDKYVSATISLDNTGQAFSGIPQGTEIAIQRRKPFNSSKGKFYTVATIYVFEREKTVDSVSEVLTLTAYDRMYWLANYEVQNRVYKKDNAHKNGWTVRQIIQDLVRVHKVPLGVVTYKGRTHLSKFETSGSFLETLIKLLSKEKARSRRKGKPIIHTRNNKLNILMPKDPAKVIRPNKTIPYFADLSGIESATVTERAKEDFATRLLLKAVEDGKGKNKKQKKHKKINAKQVVINPSNPNIQKVFGVVAKEDTELRKKDVNLATLRKLGQAKLDNLVKPDTEIVFQTRGYPNLWPGDFIFINSKRLGLRGVYKLSGVEYTFSQGQVMLTLTTKGNYRIRSNWVRFELPKSAGFLQY